MASSTYSVDTAERSALLPAVQLTVRQGNGKPATYALNDVDLLIGSQPGCDLRVAGTDNAGIICLLAKHPAGVTLRKLAPAQVILVNGRPVVHTELSDGDQIQIGLLELRMHIKLAPTTLPQTAPNLDAPRAELAERTLQLEKERAEFQQERDNFLEQQQRDARLRLEAAELRHQNQAEDRERERVLSSMQAEINRRTAELTQRVHRFNEERQRLKEEQNAARKERSQSENALADREQAFEREKAEWLARQEDLTQKHQAASATWQAEHTEVRRQLAERDSLLNQLRKELAKANAEREQALEREKAEWLARHEDLTQKHQSASAAWQAEHAEVRQQLAERDSLLNHLRKELAEKRELERSEDQKREQALDARQAEIDRRNLELTQRVVSFNEERQRWQDDQATIQQEITRRENEFVEREQAVIRQKSDLETITRQYQADVLRLDRWQGSLEEREREQKKLAEQQEQTRAQLQQQSEDLESQLAQIDEWRAQLADEADQLNAQKKQQASLERDLTERTAALDGQQATMAVLRSRMERMRAEIRAQEQQLDDERHRQEARDADLTRKAQELQRLTFDHEGQRHQYEQDRKQWLERSAVMETAVRQLKEAQDKLVVEESQLSRYADDLAERDRQIQDTEGILKGRLTQLAEAQERLDLERNALRDRSVNILQREQACETLQEQLRRRGEEITQRLKELADQHQGHQASLSELEDQRRQLQEKTLALTKHLDARHQEVQARAGEVERKHAELAGFEERHQENLNRIAVERQALAAEHARFHLEQHASLEKLSQARADFESLRQEAQDLVRQLPDAELRASMAVDRLTHARTQMREHLTEIHQYVRQCQEEQEQVRSQLQADSDKLQRQEQELRRNQDEHRLAMVAFRQQLIDWQGQVAELKRLLSRDETRLERKQAQTEERAREIEAESERLAKHAEDLDQQEREVADRRQEIDRHLVDMRQWYRRKLRDLAGIPLPAETVNAISSGEPMPSSTDAGIATMQDGEPVLVPTERNILSITNPVDAGDQKLGQVLREAQLIDADTLTALLSEARRQRRSLRQVLLASGVITLYQLALIEAGNTSGLMLGPVRVIDRIRNSTHETVYRVFDPRRGADAVLRWLAEADMTDATRPDEFRQRFTQAMLNDPHLANTLEVFDFAGRPAALQEWLVGLPATDWPTLTAAPGVCHRLLTQAAQGLAVAHKAGLVHGHLHDGQLLLTEGGVLKIMGLGEPPWLSGSTNDEETSPRDDLRTLGRIVSGWCTPTGVRKGAKTKPLPDALISVLYRLAADGDAGYRDVQELLQDLEKAAAEIPNNAEAWDRLLKYVREHGATEAMLRQTA